MPSDLKCRLWITCERQLPVDRVSPSIVTEQEQQASLRAHPRTAVLHCCIAANTNDEKGDQRLTGPSRLPGERDESAEKEGRQDEDGKEKTSHLPAIRKKDCRKGTHEANTREQFPSISPLKTTTDVECTQSRPKSDLASEKDEIAVHAAQKASAHSPLRSAVVISGAVHLGARGDRRASRDPSAGQERAC